MIDTDDIVVSTCPFTIPSAVMDANRTKRPFAYVRTKKKEHGLKKQIEGIVEKGQNVFLVDYHAGDSYLDIAKQALEDEGAYLNGIFVRNISRMLRPADVSGKRLLQIEDLVSTGGSCIKEIDAYRQKGATVDDCFAIFSYQLDRAMGQFRDAGVDLSALLTYDVLLEEAVKEGFVKEESIAALQEWRADPFAWGGNHGYPPKEK
jgi:orotate phosphoribosyltransferase